VRAGARLCPCAKFTAIFALRQAQCSSVAALAIPAQAHTLLPRNARACHMHAYWWSQCGQANDCHSYTPPARAHASVAHTHTAHFMTNAQPTGLPYHTWAPLRLCVAEKRLRRAQFSRAQFMCDICAHCILSTARRRTHASTTLLCTLARRPSRSDA
jgi:hypothetical protein